MECAKSLASSGPWGWKDPRTSLTLPFWTDLFPNLKIIVCVRNPVEVVMSLARRGLSSPAFGFSLWYAYYQELLASSSPLGRLVTHYETYFDQPSEEICRLCTFVGLGIGNDLAFAAADRVKPSLRHEQYRHFESEMPSRCKALYQELCQEAQVRQPELTSPRQQTTNSS